MLLRDCQTKNSVKRAIILVAFSNKVQAHENLMDEREKHWTHTENVRIWIIFALIYSTYRANGRDRKDVFRHYLTRRQSNTETTLTQG